MISRQLQAYNTATESTNKIHDDDTARRFGFTGGLVPGVEVHGYLSWGPVATWGVDWLTSGRLSSRYATPTYDGATTTVTFDPTTGRADVLGPDGSTDATGEASLTEQPPPVGEHYATAAAPATPPPASPETLVRGATLGSISVDFPDEKADRYLDDVREVLPLYADQGYAHPGWVVGLANSILMANVTMGPWIHVGSEVQNYAPIAAGTRVDVLGRVADEYEKSGHRFVVLDLLVRADDAPAATITHTAIYLPRQVREQQAAAQS